MYGESGWDQFSSELISTFKPVNSVKIARDKSAVLRQVASVNKYNFEFTQLVLEINNISESEKLDKYIRGLKYQTKLQVELANPTTTQQSTGIVT